MCAWPRRRRWHYRAGAVSHEVRCGGVVRSSSPDGSEEGIQGRAQPRFDLDITDLAGVVTLFQFLHFSSVGIEDVVVHEDRVACHVSQCRGWIRDLVVIVTLSHGRSLRVKTPGGH
jgi:hypothetical protein